MINSELVIISVVIEKVTFIFHLQKYIPDFFSVAEDFDDY